MPMWDKLKTAWQWFNGNKTIVSGLILGALQLSVVQNNVSPEVIEVLNWTAGAMTAFSLGHHIQKGYFSTKVGNPGQELPKKNPNVEK